MATLARKSEHSAANAEAKPKFILIVEDHPVMRRALRQVIDREAGCTVCGEAEDAASAMALIRECDPDLAIVDLTLVDSHGLELLKQIKAEAPEVRVLVYSMHDDAIYAARAVAAGATGYLNKAAPAEKIVEAIRTVLKGRYFLSPAIVDQMLRSGPKRNGDPPKATVESLSDREMEVLELLGKGSDTHQIASEMKVSPKTVDTYRQRVKAKLNIATNAELMRYAVEWTLEH